MQREHSTTYRLVKKRPKHYILRGIRNMWRYYRGWKWLLLMFMTMMLVTSTYLVFIAKTTSVATLQEALKAKTVIFDENGNEAGKLNAQKGSYVPLTSIATTMQEAVVATEDRRFYQHSGFDTIGIGRAVVRLVIRGNTSGGGGSTLTQQLVKNAFLTLDQTFNRKLKELFLALEVEKHYTKDQILEMYLNHAYFGNGVWGVEDASQRYFGHSADTLSWNESMVLTGILKGPSLYNPIDDYDAAIERRNVVANMVAEAGLLSQYEINDIKLSEIALYDTYVNSHNDAYPYYFDAVINEAIARTNIPEDDLMSKGYRIYTHLNTDYQRALDQSYEQSWIFGDDGTGTPQVQSASVVVNPLNGGVMAIYGGRGDYTHRGFNRATDMRRAPGSTIKPLGVYVPALEMGLNVHTMVPDVVKEYGTTHYMPQNYDRQTDPRGEVELYYALAQSKNTSAVYLMDQFSIAKSVQKLKQFGIEVAEQDQSLALALGAFSKGISPLQLASAYTAFPNQGVRHDSSFIWKIEDASGRVVYRNEKPSKYMVMTPNVAREMTSMMLDTYGGYGTGYGAGPDYGQVAGKTGSTEVSESNMSTRDKWMVGYTPDFVIVSWVGLDQEGEVSLDELMPNGMTALFNLQTTNLMAYSPQTPFNIANASQREPQTSQFGLPNIDTQEIQENVQQAVHNGLEWAESNSANWWETIQQKTHEWWQQATQFFQEISTSF